MGNPENHPDAAAPLDGEIDFTDYSDAQLRDLRAHIDATRFPRNFEKVGAEIDHRASEIGSRRFAVRFTQTDGIAGWFQALLSLQPFYGKGGITPSGDEILIDGWQRTWLGTAQQAEVAIAPDSVRNVYSDQEWVSFDVRRRGWWSRHYVARAIDAASALALAHLLPASRSKWFEKQATDVRDFYRMLRSPGRSPWITPLLVLTSLAIYLAQAIVSGYWLGLDGVTLVNWGANVGSLTVHGGWWRLLAALFLHTNPLHLAVNMWVLWSVGRLTERLFGNLAYIVIYLSAGLVGGLLSIAWSPAVSTVGASGAIFGILGALIAYLLHGNTRVPRRVMRAHLIPTFLFTLFSILNGLAQTGIDNAAHFGGLITGLLLGFAFAAPIDKHSGRFLVIQSATAILLAVLGAAGLLLQVLGPASKSGPAEHFLEDNGWYRTGEASNLLKWQEIANQAAAGTIASGDLARRFETEIIPFWRGAVPRLSREAIKEPRQSYTFAVAVVEFAGLRLRWAQAIVKSARSGDSQGAIDLMEKTDKAQARLDWFNLRTQYDHAALSLAESRPIIEFANVMWLDYRSCTRSPFSDFNPVSPNDLATDGPARRLGLACQAQQLFLTRNFKGLEAALEGAKRHPESLLDGDSSYSSLMVGIDDLLEYGGLSGDAVMVRLAEWRRTVPGSVHADLAEVSALIAWAYSARGLGTSDTITAQNTMIFLHRIAMASAALDAAQSRAQDYAQWYADSIDVNLLGNGTEEERRAIFDEAHVRFPGDMDLDSSMMHSLMPRWGGSFEKVAKFIEEQARQKQIVMPAEEKYARLYWRYAGLEGVSTDIFKDAYASPEIMSLGMAAMAKRYPESDYIANVAERLACQSNQRLEYLVFHASAAKHYSASAWSPNLAFENCNKKFGIKP